MVRRKIICTIGPASDDPAILRDMVLSGMDVARLNLSHGTHEEHEHRIEMIRSLHGKYRRKVRLLLDLEGYRIRIGRLRGDEGVALSKGEKVLLTNSMDVVGDEHVIPFDYGGSLKAIGKGEYIYIDDGNIALHVKAATRRYLEAEVITPGIVKERKGVNIPNVELPFMGLTEKDREDILFGMRHRVDYIAQSFVRDERDMVEIRDVVKRGLSGCRLIAKIENRKGIQNIDRIMDVSDGIMVARGDMGVSVPIYEIPMIQKMIIKKCNTGKKFVITATQMLESMTEHMIPTRAEVTDVANAVLDGSDFLMLSAETAAGKHPVEAVKMMKQIIRYTERFAQE